MEWENKEKTRDDEREKTINEQKQSHKNKKVKEKKENSRLQIFKRKTIIGFFARNVITVG